MDERTAAPSRPWWAMAVAVLAFAAAGWLVATGVGGGGDGEVDAHAVMLDVAPGGALASLASVPAGHQVLYEAAAADRETFSAVRCYCGCEAFLDHRHLLDCFERPEGGWERHATGCAVCLAEAEEVVRSREEGRSLDEIVRRIDTRYGGIAGAA